MKRYALKGINDEQHECAVCGRVELRRVMWLVEIDADGCEIGLPFHCGTTCGAKLLGCKQSKINTTVKNYASMVSEVRTQLKRSHPNNKAIDTLIDELNALNLLGSERRSHPKMQEVCRLRDEINAWAYAQEVIIPL